MRCLPFHAAGSTRRHPFGFAWLPILVCAHPACSVSIHFDGACCTAGGTYCPTCYGSSCCSGMGGVGGTCLFNCMRCPAGTYAPEGGFRVEMAYSPYAGGYTCLPCGAAGSPAGATSCNAMSPAPPPSLVFASQPPSAPPLGDDLCYKVTTRPTGSEFRAAETVIRPIAKLPAVHPHVQHQICGEEYSAGQRIPTQTMMPSRWRRDGTYTRCETRTGAEMFYSYNYPALWSANT